MRRMRVAMHSDTPINFCSRCQHDEEIGGTSRRHRSNQKSVIFTSAFEPSFEQSPGFKHFDHSKNNQGHTNTYPVDLHIDLGNFCNLACKMCNARASSTIASQHVKWKIKEDKKYLANIAKMNEGGEYEVAIKDEKGNVHMERLIDQSEESIKNLISAEKDKDKKS